MHAGCHWCMEIPWDFPLPKPKFLSPPDSSNLMKFCSPEYSSWSLTNNQLHNCCPHCSIVDASSIKVCMQLTTNLQLVLIMSSGSTVFAYCKLVSYMYNVLHMLHAMYTCYRTCACMWPPTCIPLTDLVCGLQNVFVVHACYACEMPIYMFCDLQVL